MVKCAVMHVGRRNCRFEYEMDNRRIRQTEEEKDLGVVIHDSAKPSRQCTEAAAKANKVLGMIRRTVVSRDRNMGGLGGVVVIDAAFGAHGKSRPRFKSGTLFRRCSDLGQVVNLSLSVAETSACPAATG